MSKKGYKMLKEHRMKLSFSHKGLQSRLGKKHSKEAKIKIGLAAKGRVPWNKGKHHSEETRLKMSLNHANFKGKNHPLFGKYHSNEAKKKMSLTRKGKYLDESSPHWKGNNVGYRTLHTWVKNHLGKANHCEYCGLNKIPEGKKRYFQWANKSHNYLRELADWLQLCIKCHKQYDRQAI